MICNTGCGVLQSLGVYVVVSHKSFRLFKEEKETKTSNREKGVHAAQEVSLREKLQLG